MSALSNLIRNTDKAASFIGRIFAYAAVLAVASIIVILIFSSVQRYALAHPFPITEELAGYLFVAVAFLSLTEGFTEGRHIRLLPLWRRLPDRAKGWAMVLGHAATLFILGILTWQTFKFALASYQFGSRSYVGNLLEWPWMMIPSVAFSVLGLAVFARLLVDLEKTLRGIPMDEAAISTEETL